MDESTKIILGAIVSASTLILGAIITYAFSRKGEYEKKKGDLKIQSYLDFLRGASGIAANQKKSKDETEPMILLLDAKARISIYGTGNVIKAIADFWRHGATLDSPENMKRFIYIIQVMRKENFKTKKVNVKDDEISQLLFSIDIDQLITNQLIPPSSQKESLSNKIYHPNS